MQEEFYYDEKPENVDSGPDIDYGFDEEDKESQWDVDYDTDSPGETPEDDWHWITREDILLPPVLLESPEGFLLECAGKLLIGNIGCVDIGIECRINDGKATHLRCILLRWEIEKEEQNTLRSALDALFANAALPAGTITVKARWQSGHWDIAKTHSVQFRCLGFVTEWIPLPLTGGYIPVLKIRLKNGLATAGR